MKSTIFITFVVFSLLLGNLAADSWQGYGNMSSSNLTDIWTFINGHISDAVTYSKYTQFVSNMSNHLNTLWDPAWNIFMFKTTAQKDAVLYGYAFRNHWMWYNGYKTKNAILSFVIWKDYNCQEWGYATISPSGFSSSEKDDIKNAAAQIKASADRADIWMVAKKLMNALVAKSNFNSPTKAYSIVITQAQDPEIEAFAGRICMVSGKQYTFTIQLSDQLSALFTVFQTRG